MGDPAPFFEPKQDADKSTPSFELYVKASTIDGESKGSCPLCQQWFMIAYALAQRNKVSFRVFTVSHAMPPQNFKEKCGNKTPSQYPVVIGLGGEDNNDQAIETRVLDSIDEVETFFEAVNSSFPLLKRNDGRNLDSLLVVQDITKKFNTFLQNQYDDGTKLTAYLKKIDEYMGQNEGGFLCGDELSYADCYFMPRLQHVRVAGEVIKQYKLMKIIKKEFPNLKEYMSLMYGLSVFRETMPSDQEIVSHYIGKAKYFVNPCKPTLQKPTYTISVDEFTDSDIDNESEGDNVQNGEADSNGIDQTQMVN